MKKRDFSNSSTFYNCRNTPSRNLAENNWQKMKIPNSGLNVFLSGSTGRVYQLQDRSSCRMRYLHYPTLENTRSFIKRIAKRKKKDFSNSSTCYNCPKYALAAIWQKKLTKNENSKFWSQRQRVPERQHRQGRSTNCKIAVGVECGTFTTLPSRILVALWNYEQICKFYWMTRVCEE